VPTSAAFHTGATSMSLDSTCVDPRRVAPPGLDASIGPLRGLDPVFVAGLLSACLAHERCGLHLYRSVQARTHNPVLAEKYREFGEQTADHVAILEELIARMGGDPGYVSPAARFTEKMDAALLESTFLLGGSADLMTQEMAMLEAVFLAETLCHHNWQGLAQLAAHVPEGEGRDALEGAVRQVESQEDEHLDWAQRTRSRLTLAQAQSSPLAGAGLAAEQVVARIRGWLS
jgi:demethoxyubiquinone hydroxylase (CLK1/Coq7/Cat5 family)